MAQRLIIAAGWLAAAVLAVMVGLVAVSVIGDGLTSSVGRALPESEVARELAAEPPAPVPSVTPSVTPSASAPASRPADPVTATPRSWRTPGGTVVTRCAGGDPRIVSMAPVQGFTVHEQGDDEGEFRGVADDHDRVKVDVRCEGGTSQLTYEHETRDDD